MDLKSKRKDYNMKIFANYLPQFHQIPENDKYWGKGFTDWVSCRNATPLYAGHQQPKKPLNNNYYSLDNVKSIKWQANLAKKYGITGFAIYHYWFHSGLNLLTTPPNLIRENKDIDIDYFFVWDNNSWKKTWSALTGGASWTSDTDKKTEIMAELIYGGKEEWKAHFEYLLPFFQDEQKLMMDSFEGAIHSDLDRDKLVGKDKIVGEMIQSEKASITKQIFVYLYKEIFLQIDADSGSLDIMGSMYSEFLKYALGDGGSLGKVLTPPYITDLMAKAIDINMNDRVMDLATGSGAFLVSSMKLMIDDANTTYGINSAKANKKIQEIKSSQLLGIEYDAKMYTLAASNMILRGDGSSQIKKGDTFKEPTTVYTDFNANKLLLNPPFSADNYGMPFLAYGLRFMSNKERAKAAIIIQDSAGSGKARVTNQEILKNNTLLASIKMPSDLFVPNATVNTSIYIFEVGVPHDFDRSVKFIDFRNDGYKRNKRGIKEISCPANRYHDLLLLLKSGQVAVNNPKFHKELWNLKKQYVEDVIDDSGTNWNFENHYKVNTTPEKKDWEIVIKNYMKFKLSNILDREV